MQHYVDMKLELCGKRLMMVFIGTVSTAPFKNNTQRECWMTGKVWNIATFIPHAKLSHKNRYKLFRGCEYKNHEKSVGNVVGMMIEGKLREVKTIKE